MEPNINVIKFIKIPNLNNGELSLE
jgi:hypothetical protein